MSRERRCPDCGIDLLPRDESGVRLMPEHMAGCRCVQVRQAERVPFGFARALRDG